MWVLKIATWEISVRLDLKSEITEQMCYQNPTRIDLLQTNHSCSFQALVNLRQACRTLIKWEHQMLQPRIISCKD